jgi:hypothetical protein
MKTEVILASELEPYLQYAKLTREMQVKLAMVLEHQEQIKKHLEAVRDLATTLARIRQAHNFKTDKEMLRAIRKHARFN